MSQRSERQSRASRQSNLEALQRFWKRWTFHDMEIDEVTALNRRVIIRLREYTLIITGVTSLIRCELPAVWLYCKIAETGTGFRMDVETADDNLSIVGENLRLLRNEDLAMLIPPIDQ